MDRALGRFLRDRPPSISWEWFSMHRRTTMTLGTLAPWWLLFVVLFACVALHAKTFDVAVSVSHNPPPASTAAQTPPPLP